MYQIICFWRRMDEQGGGEEKTLKRGKMKGKNVNIKFNWVGVLV
jgi:hypothetical protein